MQHESSFAHAGEASSHTITQRSSRVALLWARVLAVGGTVLIGVPLVAPVVLLLAALIMDGRPRFDYLIPGELIAVVFAGAAALLGAAILAHRFRWATATGLGLIVALFVLIGVTADSTGLASGEARAEGWPLALVAGSYSLYVLAVLADTVVGVLLCRRLFTVGSGRA